MSIEIGTKSVINPRRKTIKNTFGEIDGPQSITSVNDRAEKASLLAEAYALSHWLSRIIEVADDRNKRCISQTIDLQRALILNPTNKLALKLCSS